MSSSLPPAIVTSLAMHSLQFSKSSLVYATTVELPVVPLEAWMRFTCFIGHRQQAERIMRTQVVFDSKRQLLHIGKPLDILWLDPKLIQFVAVIRHIVIHTLYGILQAC